MIRKSGSMASAQIVRAATKLLSSSRCSYSAISAASSMSLGKGFNSSGTGVSPHSSLAGDAKPQRNRGFQGFRNKGTIIYLFLLGKFLVGYQAGMVFAGVVPL